MLNSSKKELILSGWLKENHDTEFSSPVKLQNFLLLYEIFSMIEDDVEDVRKYLKDIRKGK